MGLSENSVAGPARERPRPGGYWTAVPSWLWPAMKHHAQGSCGGRSMLFLLQGEFVVAMVASWGLMDLRRGLACQKTDEDGEDARHGLAPRHAIRPDGALPGDRMRWGRRRGFHGCHGNQPCSL